MDQGPTGLPAQAPTGRRRRRADAIERLLVVRNDRLGDLVLTLPALAAARHALPATRISVLVSSYTAPLLVDSPYVDEVIEDDGQDSGWSLGRRLRTHQFDAAVVIHTTTRNCLAVWAAGVARRCFWAYKPASFLLGSRRVWLHRSRPPIHESAFALAFLERLMGRTVRATLPLRFDIAASIGAQMETRISADLGREGPLFGVHPGNGQSAYNWSVHRYAALVGRLAEHGRVVVTGGRGERPILEAIRSAQSVRHRGRLVCYDDLQLLELAALIAKMNVLTVSSTGPMHLGGLLGTPLVALFSSHPSQSAVKWSPLGSRHTIIEAPLLPAEDPRIGPLRGPEHMDRISVEQVLEANLAWLGRDCQLPAGCHGE